MATWSCCHGCCFITVWWNCLIFGGLLQKWLILMFIILVSLYFVKDKSYEHSLIIYWTALVPCVTIYTMCYYLYHVLLFMCYYLYHVLLFLPCVTIYTMCYYLYTMCYYLYHVLLFLPCVTIYTMCYYLYTMCYYLYHVLLFIPFVTVSSTSCLRVQRISRKGR